jgi:hypothetical protein
MSKFVIVVYDLSRDSVGGVQNRAYRFLVGLYKYSSYDVIVFNLYFNNPFYYDDKLIMNFSEVSDLHLELNNFLKNNPVDFVYFIDYRHILSLDPVLLKNKNFKLIASIPDIEHYRFKLDRSCQKKLKIESIFLKKINSLKIDFLHVSCSSHKMLANCFFKTTAKYIITPVGLISDNYAWDKKQMNGIFATRLKKYKNNNKINKFLLYLNKCYYFTDNKKINSHNISNKLFYKQAPSFERIIPYYKKAILNFSLGYLETFSNSLVEGGFYGCVPVVLPSNFVAIDLFESNIIFPNELPFLDFADIQRKSLKVYLLSRTKFDLSKNIAFFLNVINNG